MIFFGIVGSNIDAKNIEKEIRKQEDQVAEAYVGQMKEKGFDNYTINVSPSDKVWELTKLSRNAGLDLVITGTSTEITYDIGDSAKSARLDETTADVLLSAPSPVLVVPPFLVPSLARG